MPLDTGGLTELERESQAAEPFATPENAAPTIDSGANIGQALRAVREFQGLTLEDVAETTRVRRAYLAAIEDMQLDALPSRPFTIGYIRAYANQLGLNGEAAVGRFRKEEPDPDTSLREPLGVQSGPDPRLGLIGVGGAVIVAAIFIWNVAQRALSDNKPEPAPVAATAPAAAPASNAAASAVALGAPLPPPVESTTPPLYETPGLNEAAQAAATADGAAPPAPVAEAPKPATPPPNLAPAFKPQGKIYGPPAAEASGVILQALRPAALVVRSPDGTVHFARYLSAGEAYRVPTQSGLTIDVPETDAFQIFAAGESKGVLATGPTPVGKLISAVPAPSRPTTAPAPKPATAAAPAPRPAPVEAPAPAAPPIIEPAPPAPPAR